MAASWGEAHTLGKPFEHRTDETADELNVGGKTQRHQGWLLSFYLKKVQMQLKLGQQYLQVEITRDLSSFPKRSFLMKPGAGWGLRPFRTLFLHLEEWMYGLRWILRKRQFICPLPATCPEAVVYYCWFWHESWLASDQAWGGQGLISSWRQALCLASAKNVEYVENSLMSSFEWKCAQGYTGNQTCSALQVMGHEMTNRRTPALGVPKAPSGLFVQVELQRSVLSVPGWLPKDSGLVLDSASPPHKRESTSSYSSSQYLVGRKIREVIKPLHEMLRWCRADSRPFIAGLECGTEATTWYGCETGLFLFWHFSSHPFIFKDTNKQNEQKSLHQKIYILISKKVSSNVPQLFSLITQLITSSKSILLEIFMHEQYIYIYVCIYICVYIYIYTHTRMEHLYNT